MNDKELARTFAKLKASAAYFEHLTRVAEELAGAGWICRMPEGRLKIARAEREGAPYYLKFHKTVRVTLLDERWHLDRSIGHLTEYPNATALLIAAQVAGAELQEKARHAAEMKHARALAGTLSHHRS
jgi:hypothetical protein